VSGPLLLELVCHQCREGFELAFGELIRLCSLAMHRRSVRVSLPMLCRPCSARLGSPHEAYEEATPHG
jgi:hypothetical protein